MNVRVEWDALPALVGIGIDLASGYARCRFRGLDNHLLRNVMVGLWLRLDDADRRDHIAELQHYLDPRSRPSALARAIADAGEDLTGHFGLGEHVAR
jgi:hypothetical protein